MSDRKIERERERQEIEMLSLVKESEGMSDRKMKRRQ